MKTGFTLVQGETFFEKSKKNVGRVEISLKRTIEIF